MTDAKTRPGAAAERPETIIGEVQLRHLPEFHAVVLTTRKPYSGVKESWEHLKSAAETLGALPTGNPVCIFYERSWVSAEASRYTVCLPTSKNEAEAARAGLRGLEDTDDEELEVREIPRALTATVFYRGPAEGSPEAVRRIAEWIGERPYLAAGAPREVHLAEPGVLGDGIVEIEIQQPVIPKPR